MRGNFASETRKRIPKEVEEYEEMLRKQIIDEVNQMDFMQLRELQVIAFDMMGIQRKDP